MRWWGSDYAKVLIVNSDTKNATSRAFKRNSLIIILFCSVLFCLPVVICC